MANKKISEKAEYLASRKTVLTNILQTSENNRLLELKNSGKILNDITLVTSSGDTVPLNQTEGVGNGVNLIFRYDKVECQSCTQEITSILKEYLKSDSLLRNIIIIGKYNNADDIRVNSNFWGTEYVYSIAHDVDSGPDEIKKPFFLLIDNDCKVNNIFIPDALNTQEIKHYLLGLSEMISNGN